MGHRGERKSRRGCQRGVSCCSCLAATDQGQYLGRYAVKRRSRSRRGTRGNHDVVAGPNTRDQIKHQHRNVVADHQPLPKYDCSCLCLSNELTARDPKSPSISCSRTKGSRRPRQASTRLSRPGLRWYTAIRPTLSRSKRGSKAGQPLTAADVALCTRHRPVRRIAPIAPREKRVAPGFCFLSPAGQGPAPCRPSWS